MITTSKDLLQLPNLQAGFSSLSRVVLRKLHFKGYVPNENWDSPTPTKQGGWVWGGNGIGP